MIGLCCQYVEPIKKKTGSVEYKNILNEKNLQYNAFISKKYSDEQIVNCYKNNLTNLQSILKRIVIEGILSFRVSSNLLPLFDSVSDSIKYHPDVIDLLKSIGKFVLTNGMRLTTHPSQFVVLSSDKDSVIENSITILKYHAWIFDQMNLPKTPYYSINIHGGKRNAAARLIDSIQKLPESVMMRLTLENDESSYSIADLLPVSKETTVPLTFDSHHHVFNSGSLDGLDAMSLALETWNGYKPLTHLSNTEVGLENGSFSDRRKHSDYVHYIPDYQLQAINNNVIDCDFEFKKKNLAIFKAVKDFGIRLA